MIKKIMIFAVLAISFGAIAYRAIAAVDNKPYIQNIGLIADISVATDTWTAIPSSPLASRFGIFLLNYDENSANFNIALSSSNSISIATTTAIAQIKHNGEGVYIDASQFVWVWAVSKHTSPENIGYMEIKNDR